MQTATANIVGDFQKQLEKLRNDADVLSTAILAAYPTADDIVDSIDLAVEDFDDALEAFSSFDPDAEPSDEPDADDDASRDM